MILLIKCGYCNKEFKTIPERCRCETECGKKREEEIRRRIQEELAQIKNSRDEDIVEDVKFLAKKISSFHSDYKERCSAEYPVRYDSLTDYVNVMNAIRNFNFS